MSELPEVRHVPQSSQFEMDTAHGPALLRYVARPGMLDLVHTEVPGALEGQGYGSALARAALDHARAEGLRVVPSCPFVSAYLRRHPRDAELVQGEGGGA